MRLIINADDFGMSHDKNIAIDKMMRQDICTNASVVVNMPWSEEAIGLAKDGNYLDRLSLHLNLTAGESLTLSIRKIPLYYQNGEFTNRAIIKQYRQVMPFHIKALREEIEAQIKKFCDYGVKLIGVDSHNWIHLRLPIWLAFKPLIKKYHIKVVRPMWIGYKRDEIASPRWARYFRIIEPFISSVKECRVIAHTSNIEQFLLKASELEHYEVVEVFVHPDMMNGEIMDMSSSYLKKARNSVINNVEQIKQYEKIMVKQILEEKGA